MLRPVMALSAAAWIADEMRDAVLTGSAAGLRGIDSYNYFPFLNNLVFASLAAERDVHDRLQAAMSDIQTSVSRVGVSQEAELALTVEDPRPTPVDETRWADDPSDEISARRRSA